MRRVWFFIFPCMLYLLGFSQDLESLVRSQEITSQERLILDSLTRVRAQDDAKNFERPTNVEVEAVLDSVLETPDSLAISSKELDVADVQPRYSSLIFSRATQTNFGSFRNAVGKDYVLGSGDRVQLSLWGDKEVQYNLTLDLEGKTFVEGIGLVNLGGLSVSDAQGILITRLSKIYSGIKRGTAHVNLTLLQSGPVKVFILGEVKTPGGYVFSGNANVLSAIYQAQGPSKIGTIRNIRLSRGGKTFTLDLYDYLIWGRRISPEVLLDGDVLFLERAQILASIEGDVGRPATYELKNGEGLRDLIQFASGMNATTADHRIQLERIGESGAVRFIDLPSPQEILSGKKEVLLQDGDRVLVEKSNEPSEDFVSISGPVKYPGTYSFRTNPTVEGLIQQAGGLLEQAFLGRLHVVRFKPNGESELMSFPVSEEMSIPLLPRDKVVLYDKKEMYLPDSVRIEGAVFAPDVFEYHQGMTIKDLVLRAGGYRPEREKGRILLARRKGTSYEYSVLKLLEGLAKEPDEELLKPDDFVFVPTDPAYYQPEVVTLQGFFVRPGKYALTHPDEKLVSVIQRAGGFREGAYPAGFKLIRKKNAVGRIGVDVTDALNRNRSKDNIGLVAGDSLYVPERLSSVKVIGEVGFETSVLYKEGASASYYIQRAGGYKRTSDKKRVVIEFANGETASRRHATRTPDAGSVIYVPSRPEPSPIDWFGGINAILGTMTVAVALILSIQGIQRDN